MILFGFNIDYNIISIVINSTLAIATVFMAYATFKTVNESIKTREETNSAEVIVYIKAEYHRMYIIVENIGSTLATNIKIKSNEPLINSRGKEFTGLSEIKFLPPNYQIKTYFDETYTYKKNKNDFPCFNFDITFTNIYGKEIDRSYTSDLGFLDSVGFMGDEMKSVEMSLYGINENLDKFNKSLNVKKEN